MTVWFRIGIHIMFFCYCFQTIEIQEKVRISTCSIWYANAENKYQEALSHDGINRFRGNYVFGLT